MPQLHIATENITFITSPTVFINTKLYAICCCFFATGNWGVNTNLILGLRALGLCKKKKEKEI
jgi:hypothetical protein